VVATNSEDAEQDDIEGKRKSGGERHRCPLGLMDLNQGCSHAAAIIHVTFQCHSKHGGRDLELLANLEELKQC
jgi:hypothetical protein